MIHGHTKAAVQEPFEWNQEVLVIVFQTEELLEGKAIFVLSIMSPRCHETECYISLHRIQLTNRS